MYTCLPHRANSLSYQMCIDVSGNGTRVRVILRAIGLSALAAGVWMTSLLAIGWVFKALWSILPPAAQEVFSKIGDVGLWVIGICGISLALALFGVILYRGTLVIFSA